MSSSTVYLATTGFVAAYMLSFWIASLARRDASIVDVGWGPGFAGIALVSFLLADGYGGRRWLVLLLTAGWGLRLGANWGQPEDHRYLVALSAGAWWTAIGPAVMSTLLMRVSGVPMLERTMAKRRPGYEEYVRRTSAFFPRPPRS